MKPILAAWMLALAIGPVSSFAQAPATKTLDIYFIDVEGGQSTLIVTPAGQTLLVDAGFPSTGTFDSRAGDPAVARDPKRIMEVLRHAGVSRINYFLNTHFHGDHMGGVPELAKLVPIDTFIDHGGVNPDAENVAGTHALFADYAAVRAKGRHLQPRPGDHLPLRGAEVTIVSSALATLSRPLAGAAPEPNAACATPGLPAQEANENPRSTGFVLQFGKFRFLDVGDLSGAPLFSLTCPKDLIGPIDAYLVAHHGGLDAAGPALFNTVKPRAAIVNNGATKGGAAETLRALHALPNTDSWQLHRSEVKDAVNFADDRIANLSEATANWIKLSASQDGAFVVTNGRTGASVSYKAR